MSLNKSKGNMYSFISHTWNTVKGACMHDCKYCYMKRWGKLNPARFDEKELKTDLGVDNFIFIGSSNDLFADDIPKEWIVKTLDYCDLYNNKYLFQTKNPKRVLDFIEHKVFNKSVVCTTIESDIFYPNIMNNTPTPKQRAEAMYLLNVVVDTFVTIEPIMKFNLKELTELIQTCHPTQVNIGADTGRNDLPEPTKEEINDLIAELSAFTTIHNKKNLNRLK